MNLIFIRHGDPDYSIDSLTEKGWREAEALSHRTTKWDVKEFYCSPLGRARDTASCTLKKLGREAVIHDWLKEFYYPLPDPTTGQKKVPWDFMPRYWTKEPMLYDKDAWEMAPAMLTSDGNIAEEAAKVKAGIDAVLAEHGYHRNGAYYTVTDSNNDTLVFFCHLGVQFLILSHLLGISAPVLWQSFFVAPSSVTVVTTEERIQGEAGFRLRFLGDTTHLYVAGEPVSRAGIYRETFEEVEDMAVSPLLKTF